jgi:crotonobetaine/carnitine-CoA ligase
MQPRYIYLVDELPLTATGKVEKYLLRRQGVPPTAFDARRAGRPNS